MSHLLNTFFKNKILLSLITLIAFSQLTFGQEVIGLSQVPANSTQTYYFGSGFLYLSFKWSVSGGTVTSSSLSGTIYSVVVQWGAAGSGSVAASSFRTNLDTLYVTITSSGPAIPDPPTITNYPGYTILTRGTPPSGEVWYWQSTSSGTSTLNSVPSIIMTSGTVYYLKSYNPTTAAWSSALTINYTVNQSSNNLSDENYIHSLTPRIATTNTTGLTTNEKIESVTYFDGLGRAMQSIGIRTGGAYEDIITHIEYDNLGRQSKSYLPYATTSTGGAYITDALTPTNNFYNTTKYENTSNPYSEKEFEASPLNRVLKQAAPGDPWKLGNGNEIEFDYLSNTSTEVKRFDVPLSIANNTYTPTLTENITINNGYYNAGELYKTITQDENHSGTTKNNTAEEFKDKQGRVILKRTYANISGSVTEHDTYYIYDDYGNLTYVLPPKMDVKTNNLSVITANLDDLGYQYVYDERNRLIEKKVPGKGWEYIVYNKLDQPIMAQDSNLALDSNWLFTKYDAFGRVAYTGLDSNNSSDRSAMQTGADGTSLQYVDRTTSANNYADISMYYNNNSYPSSYDKIHTINYYDSYIDLPSGLGNTAITYYNLTSSTDTKGLPTVSKVKVLQTSSWITTVSYYDDKGRPIYVYSDNPYLGTTDIIESKFDFTGNPDEIKTTHKKTGDLDIVTLEKFTYDHLGRVTKQTHTIDSGNEEVIAQNIYDDLGQLVSKKVGNTDSTPLQTVDYNYNVRGWLKGINDITNIGSVDLFAFGINYNNPSSGTALYNGNISQTKWQTKGADQSLKNYIYTYDALNRITSGVDNTGYYNLSSVAYDKNGNITTLVREGHVVANPNLSTSTDFGTMDNLSYIYNNGNQLLKVTDSANGTYGFNKGNNTGDDYAYDANGNMISDANKGITSISYNHLNLPTEVKFNNSNTQKINYTYDASGTKLKKVANNNGNITTIDYASGYVYENNVLKFFNHPEGYVEPDGSGSYNYVYSYLDHLGSVRLTYSDLDGNGSINPSTEILQERNTYPFGLEHQGYNNNVVSENDYKTYQGEELDKSLDLNWHHFKFRSYDAAIGRFLQIDPLAPTYVYNSTYAFAENNVVSGTDIEGLELSFALDGSRATAVKQDPCMICGSSRMTLQEVRSEMSKQQTQRAAQQNMIDALPAAKSKQATIQYPTSHISRAKYLYPQSGLMLAEGVAIGAKEAVVDVALGGALYALGRVGKSVWNLNKFKRGRVIEDALGANQSWAKNFPTIDKIEDGVATSIKSLDLTGASYQKGNKVLNTLKGYIDKLDNFSGANWAGVNVQEGKQFTGKALELAVQTGKGTEKQWNQITDAIKYALDKGIGFRIRFID